MKTPKNKPWNFCETPEEKCTMNYCNENGCQNRKRNLVEPKINSWKTMEEIDNGLKKAREEYLSSKKKSKAATFILDQIDKAIEKSNLEQQIEKTETLYRKVSVSERKPIKSGTYFSNEEEVYYRESTNKFEHNYDAHCVYPQWWLEEITNPTTQLQADKAELLEALEKISKVTNEGYMTDHTDFQVWESELKQVHSEIESLIQKHKKCQEKKPR